MKRMSKPLSPTVVEVAFAKPYRVAASRDVWVVCLAGTAWLTRDGCLADLILSPGDVAWLPRVDDALVTAMPRCRLGIVEQRGQVAELKAMTMVVTPADV